MTITLLEWSRLLLLYSHLLFCALAIALVLRADWSIATGKFTAQGLNQAAHENAWILTALWISGMALIYLDTKFDLAVIIQSPKLQLKLLCVTVLTANGLVLHWISFPLMNGHGVLTACQALLLAVTGSLSTSHWLMAAFIGLAKPLGRLSLETLASLYALVCAVTLLTALLCVPVLRNRLTKWRLSQALANLSVQAQMRGRQMAQTPMQCRMASQT